MRWLLLLAVLPLWAADDANTILRRYLDADKLNDAKAEQYTCIENRAWFARGKNGEFQRNRTETAEMIFVEGQAYRKLVARNGKPLDAKEKARVDKEMRETAEYRRKHPAWPDGGGVIVNGHKVDAGSDAELLTFFDNRVAGEEEIGGRKAWVIESTPRKDRAPANRHEKDILSFSKKLWIDEVEYAELRAVYTVIGEQIYMKPGSTITLDFQKIDEDAWQPAQFVIEVRNTMAKAVPAAVREEIRYSNFKKFDVKSTITIDK